MAVSVLTHVCAHVVLAATEQKTISSSPLDFTRVHYVRSSSGRKIWRWIVVHTALFGCCAPSVSSRECWLQLLSDAHPLSSRHVSEPRMIDDFRMIHPTDEANHPTN